MVIIGATSPETVRIRRMMAMPTLSVPAIMAGIGCGHPASRGRELATGNKLVRVTTFMPVRSGVFFFLEGRVSETREE